VELSATEIQQVVENCLRNDVVAQKKLYATFYPYCLHVCLPYTRNPEDSNDILSNAFVRIFRNLHQYNATKGSLYGWVRKITVNAALDFVQQRSRFSTHTLDDAEGIVIENAVVEKLSAAELLQEIQRLPEATGAVFNLYCIEGYNHREIAAMLNIKEGTSKWHLSEARTLLKKRLTKYITA
jgi:RNA polymerase sigma factor (sigma-70 family)